MKLRLNRNIRELPPTSIQADRFGVTAVEFRESRKSMEADRPSKVQHREDLKEQVEQTLRKNPLAKQSLP